MGERRLGWGCGLGLGIVLVAPQNKKKQADATAELLYVSVRSSPHTPQTISQSHPWGRGGEGSDVMLHRRYGKVDVIPGISLRVSVSVCELVVTMAYDTHHVICYAGVHTADRQWSKEAGRSLNDGRTCCVRLRVYESFHHQLEAYPCVLKLKLKFCGEMLLYTLARAKDDIRVVIVTGYVPRSTIRRSVTSVVDTPTSQFLHACFVV